MVRKVTPATSRREFAASLARLLPTYALLRHVFLHDLFATPHRAEAYRWLARVDEASRGVLGRRLAPVRWQAEVERLFGGVGLGDLVALVDLDRRAREIERPVDRAGAQRVPLPEVEGLPRPAAFTTKVFALGRDVAIVPHGHRNMVSMHVVLRGEMDLRHFERIEDEPSHLVIAPTIDRVARPGDLSSISSEKDNIHWLRARTDAAFTLDVVVDNLDPSLGFRYEMDYVDPAHAEAVGGGRLRARRISFAEALALYGPGGSASR
jgi:hypothetical protein